MKQFAANRHEIVVLNCLEAEDFECERPWACISIANTEEDLPRIRRRKRIGLLPMAFADISQPMPGYTLFSDSHAHDILDFVTGHWRRIHTLMVHCHAGLSRSPAVAAAIARLKRRDDGEFFEEPYIPNRLVYRILLEVASGRGDYRR